jgi:pimeloyl-ACP methyl ester carboxylesterase
LSRLRPVAFLLMLSVVSRLAGATEIPARQISSPCTSAGSECTEWIAVKGEEPRLLVFRSYSLQQRNERVTRALIFVHGIKRDADNHFRTELASAFLAGHLDDTVLIAPRFASNSSTPGNEAGNCADVLAPHEANWFCENKRPDTWRSGGPEVTHTELASFDLMDEILRRLSDRQIFPNLRNIVVAGHSAGGQFVNRYAMTSPIHDLPGINISYVVANPSSYAYLDAKRPTASALPTTISSSAPGFQPPMPANPPPPFLAFDDERNCTGFDDWPYGLKNRSGYANRITGEQIKAQAAARSVTYLLGDSDILPSGVFDISCPAVAQGPTRLARGLAYAKFMNEVYGAHHETIVVPFCGHSARCLFTADVALPVIFPK